MSGLGPEGALAPIPRGAAPHGQAEAEAKLQLHTEFAFKKSRRLSVGGSFLPRLPPPVPLPSLVASFIPFGVHFMAGALGPCVACGSASKYKCPTCLDPTCSLACSKEHLQAHLTPVVPAAAASSSSSSSSSPAAAAAVTRVKQTSSTTATSGTADRLKTNTYVPLNSYDENQFLHDYHFLSSIGRKVSSVGSTLLSQGLLPQQVEANLSAVHPGNSSQARQNGEKPVGPVFRPDFETVKRLRHREALKEEMKRRRCKVMWLPEGMGREKENRTKWDERGKKVKFSLEVAYFTTPSSSSLLPAPAVKAETVEGQKNRKLYHDLPGMLPLQVKLMSEWERESWKWASKEWKEEQEAKQAALPEDLEGSRPNHNGHSAAGPSSKRGRKRKRGRGGAQGEAFPHSAAFNVEPQVPDNAEVESVEEAADPEAATPRQHQPKTFWISDYVLSQYGLLRATHPPEEVSDNALREAQTPKPYTALPPSVLLAVQVHEVRLRNESSAKYLEWWARKGKDMQGGEGDEEEPAVEWEEVHQGPPAGSRALMPSVRGQTQDGGWPKRERPTQGGQPSLMVASAPPSGSGSQQAPPTGPRRHRTAHHYPEVAQTAVQESPTPVSAIVESISAAPASTPLLSQSLLSSLSARLGATRPQPPPTAEKVAPAPIAESGPAVAPTVAAAPAASPPRPPPAQKARPKTLLYPLPKRFLGLEALMRSIPRDHAVVEYARVEVWNKAEFKEAERLGVVGVVRHEGQEEDEEEGDEKEDLKDKDRPLGDAKEVVAPVAAEERIELKEILPSSAPAPAQTSAPAPAPKPMLSLVGYDSDSDSEEEQEEAAVSPKAARRTSVAAIPLPPREASGKTLARAELLVDSSSGLEQAGSEGEADEGKEDAAAGGLAGIARMLGMVPPASASVAAAAADADALPSKTHKERTEVVNNAQPMLVGDEEEVDWEME